MNIIDEFVNIPLSDSEVVDLVEGKANIVLYRNIHKYKNIDELLHPHGAAYILFESKPHYGHWCCVFKQTNDTIEFFNPYGGFPDDSLELIDPEFRKQSNQDFPYLSCLMYESPYNISINLNQFQEVSPDIKTCGRWCAVRMIFRNDDIKTFKKIFKNKNGDSLITLLTMWINK